MATKDAMINESASKLPEANALPDGFSEEEEGLAAEKSIAAHLPHAESLPEGFSEGSEEPFLAHAAAEVRNLFSDMNVGPEAEQTNMIEDVAVAEQVNDFSAELQEGKETEKLRKFPVALSEADSTTQAITRNEEEFAPSASFHDTKTTLDISKTKKRRAKEVKALMAATDKSADEKLRLLHAKYVIQVDESEQLEKELMLVKRKFADLSMDMNKGTVLRHKLESLCRELQRQLSEERKVAEEEQQKRQELSTKLQNSIQEISVKLEEQADDRVRQLKENEVLREKLEQITRQYEVREEHYSHQLRTKSLEYQLLEVKWKQQQELFAQEGAKVQMYTEQISQLLVTEQELRSQLSLYGDKFEQFQDTLTKSNEVFSFFKQEMEKMSSTIKKLEKENHALSDKCQKSDVSMIELLDERATLKKQLQTTTNQRKKLETLCRSLQAERKQQLLASASESPQLPCEEGKEEP